ncbi:MAG: hypothetical protein LBQ24_05660 [Candidatus Peribacteria bacterium]|nr:hypothetical protein [Candidatus Peribacteria bacterium]
MKRELKCKHYNRYVDDFVLLSKNNDELKVWREKIKKFLEEKLELKIHPNKIIMQKVSQ